MRILIVIPHVFAPSEGSLYSSQNEAKREVKSKALQRATVENLDRHHQKYCIHASLGKGRPVVTRRQSTSMGHDIEVQLYTPKTATLSGKLEATGPGLKIIETRVDDLQRVPGIASRRAIEQAEDYDVIGYMEDDCVIEDPEFFEKIRALVSITGGDYAFIPHRCEQIPGEGDVILSGDPDGGRPDLFWDTGEELEIAWPLGARRFYRATNPHSGCYFLTRDQAINVRTYWQGCSWEPSMVLSGPLEQAGSGVLLPVLKLMKPVPEHYRFLMVRHQDELWKRHQFERVG